MAKKIKRSLKLIVLSLMILSTCIIGYGPDTVKAADTAFSSAYNFSNTYGSNACIFSVQDNDPRIYFGTYGKIASSGTKYRTIGWKANLYLNGAYQESVYYSLNGGNIVKLPSQSVGENEYNLYYIKLTNLRDRFRNQAAINSGAGVIKLDAIMTVVSGSSVKGSCDDWGNYSGEVYDTEDGIKNARGWADKSKFGSYFNKTPKGMYFTINVNKGTGISSVSGGGTYIYGAMPTISASCSSGYDFSSWSNGKTSAKFKAYVTGNATYTASAKLKTYSITYDANGGSGAPGGQTKTHGQNLSLSPQKPTKEGYLFDYWTSSSDGKHYTAGATYQTNKASKMTAHWTAIKYQIKYEKNQPGKASSNVSGIMTNSTHSWNNEIAGTSKTLSKKNCYMVLTLPRLIP